MTWNGCTPLLPGVNILGTLSAPRYCTWCSAIGLSIVIRATHKTGRNTRGLPRSNVRCSRMPPLPSFRLGQHSSSQRSWAGGGVLAATWCQPGPTSLRSTCRASCRTRVTWIISSIILIINIIAIRLKLTSYQKSRADTRATRNRRTYKYISAAHARTAGMHTWAAAPSSLPTSAPA